MRRRPGASREIVAEARSRAEDEVNRLNGLKQRLSEDVERSRANSIRSESASAARWRVLALD